MIKTEQAFAMLAPRLVRSNNKHKGEQTMKPANCPYIDEKCGTHSQCVKCAPQKKWIYFLKSKIETMYYRFLADDAFRKCNAYIEEWHNDGLITDSDAVELRGHNADLWWRYA